MKKSLSPLLIILFLVSCSPPPVYQKTSYREDVLKQERENRIGSEQLRHLEKLYREQSEEMKALKDDLKALKKRDERYEEREKELIEKMLTLKTELEIEKEIKKKLWANVSRALNYKNKTNQALKFLLLAEENYYEKRYKEARRHCEKAVSLNPSLAICHERLGSILLKLDDKEGAVKEWEKALAIDPENGKLREWMSRSIFP